MYDNIGSKIKGMAQALFAIETLAAVIGGIAIMASGEGMVGLGLAVLIFVPILGLFSSWVLYGFGELIDNTSDIMQRISNGKTKRTAPTESEMMNRKFNEYEEKNGKLSSAEDERLGKIEELRLKGLISDEEYQTAISKER